jgi:TRAP-type C4-dicarboxylate transport system permease small subunit
MGVLTRLLLRCELLLVSAGALAAFGMMLLTSADAISRYLLNRPILGAYEITEKYLMVAAIFLGLSYAARSGAFIRVTFLVDRLPRRPRLVVDHLAHLATLAWCLIFLLASGQQAIRALGDSTTLTTVPVLVGPSYLLVPAGFLALAILLLADLPRVRRGDSVLLTPDAPAS